MNKNSKQNLKNLRAQTIAGQRGSDKGVRVISENPKRNSRQVVYVNKNEHGSASITKHEAIIQDKPMRGGKVAQASSRPQRRF